MLQYIGADLIITKSLPNVLKIKNMQKNNILYSKKLENVLLTVLELSNIMEWKKFILSNFQRIDC